MKCQECQEKMIEYLEGLLDERERSMMELHIEACGECGALYLESVQLRNRLLAAGQSCQSADSADAIMNQIRTREPKHQQKPKKPSRSKKIVVTMLKIAALFYVALLAYNGYRAYIWTPRLVNMTVLGQDTLYSGSEAGLRVLLQEYNTNKPLADKQVTIDLTGKDKPTLKLGQFKTGPDGCIDKPIIIPAGASGDYTLQIVPVGWDSDAMAQAITINRPQRIYVTTDKPLYQPGQTIHLRALTLHTLTLKPAARQPVTFEIEDPKGNKIYRAMQNSSDFGIAATDFTLADTVNTGLYKIIINAGGVTSEKTVNVKQYVLPKFKIDAQCSQPYYLPGELMRATVQSDYFFGKPVTDGQVEVIARTHIAGDQELFRLNGQTDAQGLFKWEHAIPDTLAGSLRTGGNAVIELEITVTDTAGHSQQTRLPIVVASQPIDIHVIPESGKLVPGLDNRIFILTAYPDGRPAACSMNINGAQLNTDSTGVAQFTCKDKQPSTLHITALDARGQSAICEKSLETIAGERRFILRTDKAVYRGGDPLAITVISANSSERMFIDIIKDRQTMLVRTIDIQQGRGILTLDLPVTLSGTLRVNAYQIDSEGRTVLDSRMVQILPRNELQIHTRPDKPVYRPGEAIKIDLQVTNQQQQPVPAALGVCAVDEAVFYVGENQPGLMEQFFTVDEEMLQPAYQIKFAIAPDKLLGGEERYQLLAQALFSIRPEVNTEISEKNAQILKQIEKEIGPYYLDLIEKQLKNPRIKNTINHPEYARVKKLLQLEEPIYTLSYDNRYDNQYKIEESSDHYVETVKVLTVEGFVCFIIFSVITLLWKATHSITKTIVWVIIIIIGILLPSIFMPALSRAPAFKSAPATSALTSADKAMVQIKSENPELTTDTNTSPDNTPPRVRHYFPETLFWQPQLITDDAGIAQLELTAADSITTWRMAIDAVSPYGQLGSCELGLKVFQDFFVDLDLPVALTRNDEISLPVVCYNYLDRDQTVELTLQTGPWCQVLDPSRKPVTLKPGEVRSVSFRLKALEVGTHPLAVLAQGQAMSDAIRREVRVRPDGRQVTWLQSDTLSGNNSHQVTLSDQAIANSRQLLLTLYPSTFSEVMEGLDNMFRMPYGCFEQTSSITYPNVMVLQYLLATRQVTPEIEAKARKFIAAGYQRLLTFEVEGGGFDWFGHPPANILLSAYGIMEFSDMAKVYTIDKRIIDRTAEWLFKKQQDDGSWPDDRDIHLLDVQRMETVAPTAYITWALAEAGIRNSQTYRAIDYLKAHANSIQSPYVLALLANALLSDNPDDVTGRQLAARLAGLFQQDDKQAWLGDSGSGMMYARGQCLDIETTALGAIALMKSNQQGELTRKALAWLTGQKDSFGTWYSTQSTILAMKALLMGMRQPLGANQTITVEVQINGHPAGQAQVTAQNGDLVQTLDLSAALQSGSNDIRIISHGGSMPYRLAGGYWVPDDKAGTPNEAAPRRELDIAVSYDRSQLGVNDTLVCTVTIHNRTASAIAMAIVDLGVPPGFQLDASRFDQMQQAGQLAKYELTGTQCILYLRSLPAGQPVTFTYHLKAAFPVKVRIQPAQVYEYYQPGNRAQSQPFQIEVQQNQGVEL